jgi:hypothetical protein
MAHTPHVQRAINVRVPAATKRAFAQVALEEDMTQQALVIRLVEDFLASRPENEEKRDQGFIINYLGG